MESIIGKDVFLDLLRAYSDFLLWWSDIISTPITKRFINKLDEHFFNNKIKQHIAIRKLKSIIEDKKIMQRDMQLTLSNLNKYHEYVYGRL